MMARASQRRRLVLAGLVTLGTVGAIAAPAWAADARAKQVTFSKDVAPIFQAKCQECHQPDSIAPMSLLTYQEVRPRASPPASYAGRARCRRYIDRSVGVQFKNDMSLTNDQVDTIVRWVNDGAAG